MDRQQSVIPLRLQVSIQSFKQDFKVRVIARRTLREFWKKHADSEQRLKSWHKEVRKATWTSINDLKNQYPSASILQGNKVVFNIRGNNYRLLVKINFEFQVVWIRFIDTHAEYNKINANKL